MDGPSRAVNLICVQLHRIQARNWEIHPAERKPCYKMLLKENKPCTAVNGQLEKPMQKYKCLSKPTANHMTHDLHRQLSHKGPVCLRVHGQAGWKDCTQRQTMEVEAHTCNTVASSKCGAQITHAIILTGSMNLLQKSKKGCPNWHTATHSLGLQRLPGMPETLGMNEKIDWQEQKTSLLVCSLARQRCLEA